MSNPAGDNGHVLNREAFAAYIVTQLDAIDAVSVLDRNDLDLTLRVGATELHLNLENFFNAYTEAPEQIEDITVRVVEAVEHLKLARDIKSFAALRERVFPMLKPIALLAVVRERQLPLLVYRPFLADLIITYVIDEPSSVAYINEEHLDHWGITEQELHDEALANLRQRTIGGTNYTTAGEGVQRIFIFSTQDGYDATRLLLPEILEQWREKMPGRMVIGIPNRDFLIAFSDTDRNILANVARQIQADSAERSYGLTDQLFTLINGEVRAYTWE